MKDNVNDDVLLIISRQAPFVQHLSLSGCSLISSSSFEKLCSTIVLNDRAKYLLYLNLNGLRHLSSESISQLLEAAKNLRVCYLSGLTQLSPSSLATLPESITALDIGGSTIFDDDIFNLHCKKFTSIRSLVLSGCRKLSDTTISTMRQFSL